MKSPSYLPLLYWSYFNTGKEASKKGTTIYWGSTVCQIPCRHLNSFNNHQFASTKKLFAIFLEPGKRQTNKKAKTKPRHAAKMMGSLKYKNWGRRRRPGPRTEALAPASSLWLRTTKTCHQIKTWKTKVLFIEKFTLRVSYSLSVSWRPSVCEENMSRTHRLTRELGS